MTIREVQQASNPEQQALYTVFDKNDRCLACRRGMSGSEVSERPSTWLPPIRGKLAEGAPAYHLYRLQDLPNRLGPAIYDTEWRGERVDIPGGALVPEARLVHRLPT
jgi:hypothetical protein